MPSPLSVTKNDYHTNPKRSDIPTPLWLCDWLYRTISPVYPARRILDPSAGDDRLTAPWNDTEVVRYELKDGKNFLAALPCAVDLVLCNPPFNLGVGRKLGSEVFLEKIVDVVGSETPIVLMTPMGFRLNQRRTSPRIAKIRDRYPRITSIVSLTIDTYEDVLFHSEILFFNMPKLPPHLVAVQP